METPSVTERRGSSWQPGRAAEVIKRMRELVYTNAYVNVDGNPLEHCDLLVSRAVGVVQGRYTRTDLGLLEEELRRATLAPRQRRPSWSRQLHE